jgi:hypothetical protein
MAVLQRANRDAERAHPVGSITNAIVPYWDEAVDDQTGVRRGAAKFITSPVDNIPLRLATGGVGEAFGVAGAVTKGLQTFGAYGLVSQATDLDAWGADPLAQGTEFGLNLLTLGLAGRSPDRAGGSRHLHFSEGKATPDYRDVHPGVQIALGVLQPFARPILARKQVAIKRFIKAEAKAGNLRIKRTPVEVYPIVTADIMGAYVMGTIYINDTLRGRDVIETVIHEATHQRYRANNNLRANSGFYRGHREFMAETRATLDLNRAVAHAMQDHYILPLGSLDYKLIRGAKLAAITGGIGAGGLIVHRLRKRK